LIPTESPLRKLRPVRTVIIFNPGVAHRRCIPDVARLLRSRPAQTRNAGQSYGMDCSRVD